MVEAYRDDMSRQTFRVAYDGDDDTHAMDVQELAPALIAFGRLVREANTQLNGKKSTVRVFVQSDFEHKCFNINFEIVQTWWNQAATFLGTDEYKNARQLLIDLGILGGGGGYGLLKFLQWKKDKPVSEIKDSDQAGIVIVQIGDGNTAHVSKAALELAENPRIRTAVEGTLAPLGTDGVSRVSFREADKEAAAFDEADARDIVASFRMPDPSEAGANEEILPDTITAWLRTYSPVFDEKAKNWRFLYGEHPIYADVSETSITADVIRRGGSSINDLYKVRMEVRQHLTEGGNLRPEYKIIEVLDFKPAPKQGDFPF